MFVFVARTIKRDGQYFEALGCEGEAYFDSGDKRAGPLRALASNSEFSFSFKMLFLIAHCTHDYTMKPDAYCKRTAEFNY